ncbi:MAG: radical SAM protein [Candidatus Zixiibacteriota bacterium]
MDQNTTPRMFGWGITNRCNLSCPHCYSSANTAVRDELTTDECRQVIDVLNDLSFSVIGWTGGEPLVRRDLDELISYAHNHYGITSAITTNGLVLTPLRAEELRAAGVQAIQVSIDGSTAAANGRLRLASDKQFEQAIDAVRTCKDLGIQAHMAMLVGQENLNDVIPYVDLARSLGVESVRLCGFVPWGGGISPEVRQRLEFTTGLPELSRLVQGLQEYESPVVLFDPAFGPLPPGYLFHTCVAGVETCYLAANGDVYPCTGLLDSRFRVGNVRETSLRDLWQDPRMREIALYDRGRIDGPCRGCEAFDDCLGGCRGAAFAHTGDLDASFPVCLRRV